MRRLDAALMNFGCEPSPSNHPLPQGRVLRVAFGPCLPRWGSWDWLGADTARELSHCFHVLFFHSSDVPECDVAVIIKHLLPPGTMRELAQRAAVIYCPVDYYGTRHDIEADGPALRRCSTIVVHCQRLRNYFARYAPVEYLDHHVKFVSDTILPYQPEGYVLWTGVRTNLPPLVNWLNATAFDLPLLVLTNFEDAAHAPPVEEIGLRHAPRVALAQWSPTAHQKALLRAKAALDIKGDDFRQRHKPPAKAIDFIASGLPLAMNASSSIDHLAGLGLKIASPRDTRRWFSREYWQETAALGATLRKSLSVHHIGLRWRELICEAFRRRRAISSRESTWVTI